MKLLSQIVFIVLIVLKASSGFSSTNHIADIIVDTQNIKPIYTSIVDKSSEEQNVAKYYKLSDLFANPKANEIVLLRGKLVQSLNNEGLFVFQDGSTIANITIEPSLWEAIDEKTYILDKNLQFLAKVNISETNHSITLQAIKIFHKISDTDNYILSQSDKKIANRLASPEVAKITARTIVDAPAEKKEDESKEEEEFDSVEDTQNKAKKSLYGVPATEEAKKAEEEQAKAKIDAEKEELRLKEDAERLKNEAKKASMPEDKPAEEKKDGEDNVPAEVIEEVEPEIYNKVPEEEQLQTKKLSAEEKSVLTPEEIQRLEQYDKNPPAERKKRSFFSFGK